MLGIILAAQSSRGHHLVFRHPPPTTTSSSDLGAEEPDAFGYTRALLAELLTPKVTNRSFEFTIGPLRFVGHPTSLAPREEAKEPPCLLLGEPESESEPHQEAEGIRSVNIAFVLPSTVDKQMISVYQDFSSRIATALRHEEQRCFFLSKSVAQALELRDDFSRGRFAQTELTHVAHLLLKKCSFAQALRDLFQGLSTQGRAMICVNNWIHVHMNLKDAGARPSRPFRPYDAILPLDTSSESPELSQLLHVAHPSKSFQDLHLETEFTLAQLYRHAAHLTYWGQARVVETLNKHGVYTVSPASLDTSPDSPLSLAFSTKYPSSPSLTRVLQRFSRPRPLGEHIQEAGVELVSVVVWLLGKKLLIQRHTYFFLNITLSRQAPARVPVLRSRGTPRRITSGVSFSDHIEDSIEPEIEHTEINASPVTAALNELPPGCLLPHESEHLQSLATGDDSMLIELIRLSPYLRGRHTAEEIMWRENMPRTALTALIARFSDLFVQCIM